MSQVPYLTDAKLQEEAAAFLKRFHPAGSLPVPIEYIVEFGLELEIAPLPALMQNFGMDGWLSHDLQTITVDQEIMETCVNRYRFTLAHEIGHRRLHAEFIRARRFYNIDAWRSSMAAIPKNTYKRLELQANAFASFVLVPMDAFKRQHFLLSERAPAHEVVANLASCFEVSSQVIEFRLQKLTAAKQ